MTKIPVTVAALLIACSQAQAQTTIDVSKITCGQYNSFKVEDPLKIAIWLSGYYHGLRKDTVLERQRLDEDAERLTRFCYSNEMVKILDAVERVIKDSNTGRK
jgi:acid stress chaperone HdeB